MKRYKDKSEGWYQSFSFLADGTWETEFHKQSPDHPDFIVRIYDVKNHGWRYKCFTTHWRMDNFHIFYL